MQKGLVKVVGVASLALLVLSSFAAAPQRVAAQGGGVPPPGAGEVIAPPYAIAAEPVWATLNAVAQGNYPGGNEQFTVFVVNSDSPPLGNVTVLNETLSAPFQNASVTGLPVQLAPGHAMLSSIYLQIPRDFSKSNFSASVTIHVAISNASASVPTVLSGTALVYVLGTPIGQAASASSTQQASSLSGPQPVWATLNALPYGNYPGGNEKFVVFVANSDSPPLGNVTLINETLTAPSLPPSFNTGTAIGLPVQLSTGQAIPTTISLAIPANFAQGSFTATVVINMQIANGTSFFSKQLTESTTVAMLNLPGTVAPPSTTTSGAPSSQTTSQAAGGSSGLLYAAVGVAAVVVIVLLALVVRRRSPSK